jgi:hypothetical protein
MRIKLGEGLVLGFFMGVGFTCLYLGALAWLM